MFEELYQQLGLTQEEAKMYQSLLEEGPKTASSLAQATGIKRTYIYTLIRGLIQKGLVFQSLTGQTTTFTAQAPDKLLELVETQKQEVLEAQKALENVLPSLKSLYALSESKPIVTYYEGLEGIKRVYLDTLKDREPILALVETTKIHPDVYSWVTQVYAQERVAAGIAVKAIVGTGERTAAYERLNEKEMRETKLINSEKFPFQHEINVYGSKLAILNHKQDTRMVGIIIDHPDIAKTFRAWFELTWDLLG